MTTGTKNLIRITVLAGILAWPGIETARLLAAKQELAKSAEQARSVNDRWASLKKTQTPPPVEPGAETVPVNNPGPTSQDL